MKIVKEIELMLDELQEADQPNDEIAWQILNLIRNKNIEDIVDG